MANLNRVLLIGNLTRDPQLKYLPNQTPVAEFGLATNRKFRLASGEDREEVTFVDVTAFGKPAEIINQYCQKGKQIFIEGRLKFDSWEDKQTGGKRSKLTVVVENFQFLGGRDGGQAGGGGGSGSGGYDAEHGGGGGVGHDETSQVRRPAPPRPMGNRGPATGGGNAPRPQQQQPAQEPPFSEDQQFRDDDIPF